jgi:type II secretory pathway component GspD/PulD (secretin)
MITTKPIFAVRILIASILFLALATAQAQQANRGRTTTGRGGGGGFGGIGTSGSRTYTGNGTVGEAMVTSDPDTRRLIVITDEETSQFVGQVVTNLDTPKPQVLINVVFLEVTYNKNFDFGIESAYRKNIDNSTTFGGTNIFGGLGAQGAADSVGGPGAGS